MLLPFLVLAHGPPACRGGMLSHQDLDDMDIPQPLGIVEQAADDLEQAQAELEGALDKFDNYLYECEYLQAGIEASAAELEAVEQELEEEEDQMAELLSDAVESIILYNAVFMVTLQNYGDELK